MTMTQDNDKPVDSPVSAHTPGPWTHQPADDDEWYTHPHEIRGAFANGVSLWVGGAEHLEDARLIAAAPDLLDVLVDMFERPGVDIAFAGNPNACDALEAKARAAIVKAREVAK